MTKQASPIRGRGGYLDALLASCPAAILATNSEGVITFANREACKLAEREMHEIVGKSITTIYENLEAARETNRQLYQNGGLIRDHESKAKTRTGKIIPVRISAAHMTDSSGKYIGAVGFFETYRPWTAEEAKIKTLAEDLETELEEQKVMGAPIVQIYPGLSLLPIVGRLDVRRFERISTSLSNQLKGNRTQAVLIDLSAAMVTDEAALAEALVKTLRTLNLLGVECILGGVQPALARCMEPLVPNTSSVKSFAVLDMALRSSLGTLGFDIRPKA